MTRWTGRCPRWPVYWTVTAISRRTRRPATVEEPDLPQRRSTLMDPPDRGPPRQGRLQVHAGRPVGQACPADQLVLQPAGGGPRIRGAAPGDVGLGQAPHHRLRRGGGGQGHLPPHRPLELVEEGLEGADGAEDGTAAVAGGARAHRPDRGARHRRGRRSRHRGFLRGRLGPAGGRRVAGGNARPRPAPGSRTMTRGPAAGKTVVLGVTGGIAAYKAVEVCRRLVDAGAHVVPVLTEDATRFVGEVTFSALASEPVQKTLWSEADPIPHTHLGQRADLRARRSGDGALSRLLRERDLRRVAERDGARHPGAGDRVSGHAHRDVGAPGRPGESGHAASTPGDRGRSRPKVGWPAVTSGPGAWPSPPTSWPPRWRCWDPRTRWTRSGRPACGRERGRHARAHRPGAVHLQPVLGQTGSRRRRGGRGPRRRGRPRDHGDAPDVAGHRRRQGGDRGGDGDGHARPRRRTPTSS